MNSKRILVPVNLPKSSFNSLLFAQGLANEVPIHLTLLNVVNLNVSRLKAAFITKSARRAKRR